MDIPKDIQLASGDPEYPESVQIRGYKPASGVHVGQLKKAYKLLKSAKRPLILAGGGVNISGANELFRELVETMRIPVVTTIMGEMALGSRWRNIRGEYGRDGMRRAVFHRHPL